jgi:hypothetical protein
MMVIEEFVDFKVFHGSDPLNDFGTVGQLGIWAGDVVLR